MAKKATEPGSTPFDDPPYQATEPVSLIANVPKPKGRGPIMDGEMKVMNAINRAIAKLPNEAAKIRVLRYMIAKLEFPLVDKQEGAK